MELPAHLERITTWVWTSIYIGAAKLTNCVDPTLSQTHSQVWPTVPRLSTTATQHLSTVSSTGSPSRIPNGFVMRSGFAAPRSSATNVSVRNKASQDTSGLLRQIRHTLHLFGCSYCPRYHHVTRPIASASCHTTYAWRSSHSCSFRPSKESANPRPTPLTEAVFDRSMSTAS